MSRNPSEFKYLETACLDHQLTRRLSNPTLYVSTLRRLARTLLPGDAYESLGE